MPLSIKTDNQRGSRLGWFKCDWSVGESVGWLVAMVCQTHGYAPQKITFCHTAIGLQTIGKKTPAKSAWPKRIRDGIDKAVCQNQIARRKRKRSRKPSADRNLNELFINYIPKSTLTLARNSLLKSAFFLLLENRLFPANSKVRADISMIKHIFQVYDVVLILFRWYVASIQKLLSGKFHLKLLVDMTQLR